MSIVSARVRPRCRQEPFFGVAVPVDVADPVDAGERVLAAPVRRALLYRVHQICPYRVHQICARLSVSEAAIQ